MTGKHYYLILVAIALLAGTVVSHEATHGQIFKYYGCQNVSYGVEWDRAYTQCNDLNYIQSKEELLAHSNNEVVGYNITPLLWAIFVLGLVYAAK